MLVLGTQLTQMGIKSWYFIGCCFICGKIPLNLQCKKLKDHFFFGYKSSPKLCLKFDFISIVDVCSDLCCFSRVQLVHRALLSIHGDCASRGLFMSHRLGLCQSLSQLLWVSFSLAILSTSDGNNILFLQKYLFCWFLTFFLLQFDDIFFAMCLIKNSFLGSLKPKIFFIFGNKNWTGLALVFWGPFCDQFHDQNCWICRARGEDL